VQKLQARDEELQVRNVFSAVSSQTRALTHSATEKGNELISQRSREVLISVGRPGDTTKN
jgi:hypothetical protein